MSLRISCVIYLISDDNIRTSSLIRQPPGCSHSLPLVYHFLVISSTIYGKNRNMMTAISKDPANRVTERDKAENPIAWVQRMNMFQAQIHEIIYEDLIYS